MVSMIAFGCHELSLTLPEDEEVRLLQYDGGHIIAECVLPAGDSRRQAVDSWLLENRSGWSPTPVTYVPHNYVTGQTFSVNFRDSSVVVNYDGGQYVRDADRARFPNLACPEQ